MDEITFLVEEAPEGGYIARASGDSIFTEADDLESLEKQIHDAVIATSIREKNRRLSVGFLSARPKCRARIETLSLPGAALAGPGSAQPGPAALETSLPSFYNYIHQPAILTAHHSHFRARRSLTTLWSRV